MYVVITGGSRGIGAEAVRRFTTLGHRVTFLYEKHHESARAVAEETGAEAICCDVADSDRMAEIFAALPEVDLLITCAGIASAGLLQDTTEDAWQRILNVNVSGTFHAIKGVLPGMIRNQAGCIITISSIWGQCGGSMEVPYSATKGAIIAMTKALAQEVGPSHVRVNCIAPGAIQTDMIRGYEDTLENFRLETPLEMLGLPAHIADAMVYLANAEFVTGQVLGVNGGYYM